MTPKSSFSSREGKILLSLLWVTAALFIAIMVATWIGAERANPVLLDLETVTARGPWSDWSPWLVAMKLADLKPAGTLRFSHYDQVVQAAIDGSGVAIGRHPHNARHLREGVLVAPLGRQAVRRPGAPGPGRRRSRGGRSSTR